MSPQLSRREKLRRRFGKDCAFCGIAKADTKDHIVPKSRGGSSTRGNLIPACRQCNGGKGSQTIIPVRAFVIFEGWNDFGALSVSSERPRTTGFYRKLRKHMAELRGVKSVF